MLAGLHPPLYHPNAAECCLHSQQVSPDSLVHDGSKLRRVPSLSSSSSCCFCLKKRKKAFNRAEIGQDDVMRWMTMFQGKENEKETLSRGEIKVEVEV